MVTRFDEREAKRGPPAPFTTSTLQQAGSVTLNLDPKATMEAAQKLYEQGHITYHRTDNPNISEDALADIYAVAVSMGLDMAERPRTFKAPEGAHEGHPAITPTHWDVAAAGDTAEQRVLYGMIRLRAIASQLADARYAVRTVRLEAAEPVLGKPVAFEARGRSSVYGGWLKLLEGDQTEENHGLPDEPATYAAIMDTIISRAYVKTDQRNLVPTETGYLVVDSLATRFQFIELGYTRDIERDLDLIAQGEVGYKTIIQGVHENLQREIGALHLSCVPKNPCPQCGKPLQRKKGKNGYFWGCTGYPDCTTTLPDKNGEPGQAKTIK